jgi:hypothetical protein
VPLYFLTLSGPNGESHDHTHGTDFFNEVGALEYAKRFIRELRDAGGYDN